jgi:hypothetical protein
MTKFIGAFRNLATAPKKVRQICPCARHENVRGVWRYSSIYSQNRQLPRPDHFNSGEGARVIYLIGCWTGSTVGLDVSGKASFFWLDKTCLVISSHWNYDRNCFFLILSRKVFVDMRFEIITAVLMKIHVLQNVTPRRLGNTLTFLKIALHSKRPYIFSSRHGVTAL